MADVDVAIAVPEPVASPKAAEADSVMEQVDRSKTPSPSPAAVAANSEAASKALAASSEAAAEEEGEEKATKPEPVVDIEAEAAKRRRQESLKAENRKRGVRMFGLLQSTLKQAKQETGKIGKNRQEIDERLQAKLSTERQEVEDKRRRDREAKDLRMEVSRKEDEIGTADSIYRTRHNAKLNLASYLCTTFALPPPPPATDGITVPFAPRLPHSLRLTNPTGLRPLYYLPYRLLPFQRDQIEDQIAAVKKAVKRERDDWEDLKDEKEGDLASAKRKRDDGMEEIVRAEREERQKRRREAEERDERASSRRKSMDVDGDWRGDEDRERRGEGGEEEGGFGRRTRDHSDDEDDRRRGDSAAARDRSVERNGRSESPAGGEGKMDVEGEELEY
ncbi:hypothetical protein T439DRAFT_381087 [Meredithblackwellia eburnea MCA 4105]